jgi:hypothetical protein
MFLVIYSIFLIMTPQHSALSSETSSASEKKAEVTQISEGAKKAELSKDTDQSQGVEPSKDTDQSQGVELSKDAEQPFDMEGLSSATLSNLALKGFKNKKSSSELVPLIEKSLSLNPYRLSLYKLRSEILSKESFSGFEVPLRLHILTAFKPLLTFVLFSLFLLMAVRFYARIYNAKINFKVLDKNIKLFFISSSFLALLLFSAFIWHYNKVYSPWICVTSKDARLYTAPTSDSVVLRSLPRGACLAVAKTRGDWLSLNTEKARGWISKKQLTPVRGR